jgi:hypothetical protein
MGTKRLALVVAGGAVLASVFGTTAAWAPLPAFASPPEIYKVTNLRMTGVGFMLTSDPAVVQLPVGSRFVVTALLLNGNSEQFGKKIGTPVGRLRVECTAISDKPDGYCSGVVHVPGGFFVIAGSAPFSRSKSTRWAVIGGVGPYVQRPAEFFVDKGARGTTATLAWR